MGQFNASMSLKNSSKFVPYVMPVQDKKSPFKVDEPENPYDMYDKSK